MTLHTKQDFSDLMHRFLNPLKPFYSEDGARLRLGGAGATYGQEAIELEAFSRPLWALAPFWAGGGSDAAEPTGIPSLPTPSRAIRGDFSGTGSTRASGKKTRSEGICWRTAAISATAPVILNLWAMGCCMPTALLPPSCMRSRAAMPILY